ncbi:Magnesium transporter NIPA [Penicillium expansum]|uniref:Magnesium transporter NIPA n=1 Tax=Penicillium expansum TaxID=27334 RepID=A0A0A2JVC8_PENEN|nr:Magnesium transporter NIPA [Penicillium expansum]KGO58598.1 Magnesium transporter NIPA [Penicillium expansum]
MGSLEMDLNTYGVRCGGVEQLCTMIAVVSRELMNTAAYAFAPAVLVTPLGALSVLIGALMGSYFLREEINVLGKLGCAACLLGSVLLVLHAPGDKDIETIDEILHLAIQPLFLLYCLCVAIIAIYIIWKVAPVQGRTNPLVYISICSSVGSISVMSVKAFGIAVKLTAGGDNQFTHASTYVFALVLVVTTLTQMNYLNKAMGQFPASLVAVVGFIISCVTLNKGARYVACFLFASGVSAVNSVILGWVSATLGQTPEKKAASISFINVVANASYIYTAYLYPKTDGPRYLTGMSANTAFGIATIGSGWALRWWLQNTNKKISRGALPSAGDVLYAY